MSRPKLLNIFDESPDKILYTKTPSYVTVVQTDDSLVVQDTITEIQNASIISFVSPCNCNIVNSITINGLAYAIKDATGKPISECGSVFVEGTTVTVTLDIINKIATLASSAYGLTKESKIYIDQSAAVNKKYVDGKVDKFITQKAINVYNEKLCSICYGDLTFVAAAGFKSLCSRDGISWNYSTGITEYDTYWFSVCYGSSAGFSRFVAIGANNSYGTDVAYSDDGINWTVNDYIGWQEALSVCYGDEKFVAVGRDDPYYSSDGISWTVNSSSAISGKTWNSVCYGGGKFVAVGTDSVAYSMNGITWFNNQTLSGNNWKSVCYGNDKFVAVGTDSVAYSTDGINWTTNSLTGTWKSVCYGEGLSICVAIGYNGEVAFSMNGIDWTLSESVLPSDMKWCSVCYDYDHNKFFVSSEMGNIAYSEDGIVWSYKNKDIEILTSKSVIISDEPYYSSDATNKKYVDTKIDTVNGKISNLGMDVTKIQAYSGTATLKASSWTGTDAPYTYNLSFYGVTNTSYQDILPSTSITAEQIEALSAAVIVDGGQSTNTIILKAFGEKPTIDIPIRIIIRQA